MTRGIILALALATQVAGCAERATASRGAKGGDGPLRLSFIGEPHTLNPNLQFDEYAIVVGQNIFNRLVSLAVDGSILPDLARSWEESADGLTYTFHLRDDVVWHDGRPFTSDDARVTLRRVVTESSNRDVAARIADVTAPDRYTVSVHLSEPWAAFLPSLAWYGTSILPAHIYGDKAWKDHPANSRPIGTGPFKFKSWDRGSRIVLEKNDAYFGPGPYVDEIQYLVARTPRDSVDLLIAGQADLLVGRPPADRIPELLRTEHISVTTAPADGRTYLAFNLRHPPFDDIRVRRAVSMAIDRRALIDNGLAGIGAPALGFYTPAVEWAYNGDAVAPGFDPTAARRAIRSWVPAGFSATLACFGPSSGRTIAAELSQQLERVGLRVRPTCMDPDEYFRQVIGEKNFDLTLLSGAQGPDPDNLAGRFGTRGAMQVMGYANSELDEVFARGGRSSDMAVRTSAYRRAQEILAADLPMAPLVETVRVTVCREGLRGLPQEDARGLVPEFTYNLIRMPAR